MAEQAANILGQYGLTVEEVRKGRGHWIVYSNEGVFSLKECRTGEEHLKLLRDLTDHIVQTVGTNVQQIITTPEGALTVRDIDDTPYMLQTFCEGRECNIRDSREWERAIRLLAQMHRGMQFDAYGRIPLSSLDGEFCKRNRELRKIRRYLKEKRQKNEFERILYNQYGCFLEQALKAEEEWLPYERIFAEERKMWFCHGDYQYHNVWFGGDRTMILNLEGFLADAPCRDLYQFMRKILEKNNWDQRLGQEMLDIYERERELPLEEKISLIYRFSYPEKFWKIANHYYNGKKSFTPGKSEEKLQKVFLQEEARQSFIEDCLKAFIQ